MTAGTDSSAPSYPFPLLRPCDAENGDQLSINSKDKSAFDLQGMDIIALLQPQSAWLALLDKHVWPQS